jgi:GNAT superfamily N-acetyltransferase
MTTPGSDAELDEAHVLDDGTSVVLRPIRPGDVDELRRGFAELSEASRYRRFLHLQPALSDETLRYLTNVDGKDHVAIVAACQDGRGLGVARFIRVPKDPTVAEPAITVIDDKQHKGLGRILALALARAALARGITHFRGLILEDNQPVRQLLDEVGATIERDADGEMAFDVDLRPPRSDETSLRARLELVVRSLLRAASSRWIGRRR